ncbi:DEAD/DEAH box helicase [Lichenibacterium dinghuense]|uniref:DEAD/DEAH box helicase n=1 Tax=Lichenibacterium dinghuense TaxID=2895977 RepID=UPI001F26C391|nr:DEAD/DEAH box helicase [Lichenibacterium sp. 6Y81]
MTTFTDLGLPAPILQALAAEGYETPTPIQAGAIPHVLAGRDLLGIAQTGTGKTAAFSLPILGRLTLSADKPRPRACRVLILSPTRELASQIEANIIAYAKFLRVSTTLVFGGVPVGRQIRACAPGVDVVVATPGRLIDLLNQRALTLDEVGYFVLDEADRMLDLGFMRDIQKIVGLLPKKRQSLFFSATMPPAIAKLASSLLTNPVEVAVAPVSSTAERIRQSVIFCPTRDKQAMLHGLLADDTITRALVFTRTKHGADKVVKYLNASGFKADAIHGNKSQNNRERALAAFKSGASRLLVATDIAARGIDVDGVSHVINFDIPNISETYVHRIGRTARAGADGEAVSLCGEDERSFLRDIERLIRQKVPVIEGKPGSVSAPTQAEVPYRDPRAVRGRQGQGGKPQGQSHGGGENRSNGGRPGQNRQGQQQNGQRHGAEGAPRPSAGPSRPAAPAQHRPRPAAQGAGQGAERPRGDGRRAQQPR